MARTVVIAIGGNSLISDSGHQSVGDQYEAAAQTCVHIASMLKEEDLRLVVTHGNGPQVGFILRRSEIAAPELHMVPLDSCVADTQGALGYQLQRAMHNEFRRRGVAPDAGHRGDPGAGGQGRPGAAQAQQADRLVHVPGAGGGAPGQGRLGPGGGLRAAAGGGWWLRPGPGPSWSWRR